MHIGDGARGSFDLQFLSLFLSRTPAKEQFQVSAADLARLVGGLLLLRGSADEDTDG